MAGGVCVSECQKCCGEIGSTCLCKPLEVFHDDIQSQLATAQRKIAELEAEVRSARFDMTDSERILSSRLFTCRRQIRGMQQEHDRDCAWIVQMGKERDQAQQQVRDLRAALEWIARKPCADHYGGFREQVDNCHDYQRYLAAHPDNWPDDYLVTVAAGKQMCDGCFARAALAATAEPEAER